MATVTAQGSGGDNNNTGRIIAGATVSTSNFNGLSIKDTGKTFIENNVNRGFGQGVKNTYQTAAVTATSVADNGSGYCRFTKSSHNLTAGTVLEISGATASSLNTIHTITAVPTGNTFDTNIPYTASATAGDYQVQAGDFNVQTNSKFFGTHISPDTLAGVANTALSHNGHIPHDGLRTLNAAIRLDETSWNRATHAVTKGANAGVSYNYPTTKGSGTVDEESQSVYVYAGSITYMDGDTTPTTTDYPSYTG